MSPRFGFSNARNAAQNRSARKAQSDAQLLEAWNTPSPIAPVGEDASDGSLETVDLAEMFETPVVDADPEVELPEVESEDSAEPDGQAAQEPEGDDAEAELDADDSDLEESDAAIAGDGETADETELEFVTAEDEADAEAELDGEDSAIAESEDATTETEAAAEDGETETTEEVAESAGDLDGDATETAETEAETEAEATEAAEAEDSETVAGEDDPEAIAEDEGDEADETDEDEEATEDELDEEEAVEAIADLEPQFKSGTFTVGESGQVGIDWLWDGGRYRGQLGIFSLDGLNQFEAGSEEFIQEMTARVLSGTESGHLAIDDATEGARFRGDLDHEKSHDSGDYRGVKTFVMRAGDTFGLAIVPDGTFAQLAEDPNAGGALRPLFSMVTANPNEQFQMGQIVDLTGDGNAFAFEDLRLDGRSDRDYNDMVVQVRGAVGKIDALADDFINSDRDWRESDAGQLLVEYTKPYITPEADPVESVESSETEELAIDDSAMPLEEGDETDPGKSSGTEEVESEKSAAAGEDESEAIADDSEVAIPEPKFETDDAILAPALIPDAPVQNQPLIGIIDTGFAANNPDLNYQNITLGRDWVDGDNNPLLAEGEGNEHGTHILGIIAAQQDNGVGIDGMNDDAPIWVGRAVGSGKWAESLIEFVDAAQESGQPNAVVNLSMDLTQTDADGNTFTRYELTPGERAALEYARQHNVLVVVAAGNDSNVMSVLGQAAQEFDNLLTVGASDGLERADFSSYGNGLGIMADGGTTDNGVLSTVGDGVGTMAGTSVATAKVTGAVSQVWAANPDLSYRQVIEVMKDTARDLADPNWDRETGAGLLNLAAAVHLAKITTPEAHYAPSSLIPESWSGQDRFSTGERAVQIHNTRIFSGSVTATIGANLRSGPSTAYAKVGGVGYQTSLQYDAWQTGEYINYPGLGSDDRWYRLAGTNQWISAAITTGEPPAVSTPQPTTPSTPTPSTPTPTNPSLTNPILSQVDASYFNARPQYYTTGNIFALSMYGSSLVGGRGYTEGNCTWYAHGRVLELGGNPAALKSMYGNANQWHTQISNGTQIVSSPQPGDIAQWTSNGANHVAVVEKVNSDGTIVISESHYSTNWDGGGSGTLHSVRTISANNPDRFIRVPGVQVQDGTPASTAGTFTGRVIATIGANLRDNPTTQSGIVGTANYGATLTFDAVETGEFISIPGLGTATDQWYRIAGTDAWISAALIYGSPSESADNTVAKPGEQQAYVVKAGDTLWGIAQRYLGDGNRWRELQKADGSTFTDAEALTLQIGQLVYIPMEYEEPDSSSGDNSTENENRPGDKNGNEPDSLTDSISLQFELDNAGLWGSGEQGLYGGGDWRFDNIGFKESFGIGEAYLNTKGGVSAYVSSGTFDAKLPGTFDFSLEGDSFSVFSNIGNGETLFSSNLGAGLGIDFELGTGIGINSDIPIIGGSNFSFKSGLELDGADVLFGAVAPAVAEFVDIDTGISIVDREFDAGKLEGEDNLGVKMSLTDILLEDKQMGGIKVDELLSLDLGAYLNQSSSLELKGFRFDHDNDNQYDLAIGLGESGSVVVPNGLENLRVQPITKLKNTFSFKVIGEAAVSFQNAIDSLIPDLIKVNPAGLNLEPQLTFKINEFDFDPFEVSNSWFNFKS